MTDTFARQTAKHAHERISEMALELANVKRKLPRRPPMFIGLCALCGEPCKPNRRYCHAHAWAEGTD